MKTEIRTKTVKYAVYIAKDGKEFETKNKCIFHEKKLDGIIKECPECHGKGKITKEYEYDNYHTGAPEKSIIYPTCTKCNGKGYLEKKNKEVWE